MNYIITLTNPILLCAIVFLKTVNEYLRGSKDAGNIGVKFGRNLKKKVQNMLWSKSHCPVDYIWRDLGARFWPRYVREGACLPPEKALVQSGKGGEVKGAGK